MQKIMPFLWFNREAEEAARFYVSVFDDSKLLGLTRYNDEAAESSGLPEGSVMTASLRIHGKEFVLMNGGPGQKFSPAISFFVSCKSEAELNRLCLMLMEGGRVLMPLDDYGFSRRFGWLTDKYGVSWLINCGGVKKPRDNISPCMILTGKNHGKAKEIVKFYTSSFRKSAVLHTDTYGANEPEPKGAVKGCLFKLEGCNFIVSEARARHNFGFTQATSFVINCRDQKEIDHYWKKLASGGKEGRCGWLTDKHGVSWQVVPENLAELVAGKDAEKSRRAMAAMLGMKKLDLGTLKNAYAGLQ